MIRYLEFALGKGVGEKDEEDEEPEAAVGLEDVAQMLEDEEDVMSNKSSLDVSSDKGKGNNTASSSKPQPKTEEEDSEETWHDVEIKKEDPANASDESNSSHSSQKSSAQASGPAYSYGAVSDKVGEAAACWLTRWGADILQYEERHFSLDSAQSSLPARGLEAWNSMSGLSTPVTGSSSSGSHGRKRATTVPSRPAGAGDHTRFQEAAAAMQAAEALAEMKIPMIWRKGGLSARWVRGLLSSDALFVKGEKERYDIAKTIVEMRRAVKGEYDEEEENEWMGLFASGIYYTNMVSRPFLISVVCQR